MAEIGNRKERVRVREAGASAAGRGQRPYASFLGFLPLNPLRTPSPPLKRAGTPCTRERGVTTRTNRPAGRVRGLSYGVRRFKAAFTESGFASLPDSCFLSLRDLGDEGVTMGLPPQALPEGDSPSDSLLRFAAV